MVRGLTFNDGRLFPSEKPFSGSLKSCDKNDFYIVSTISPSSKIKTCSGKRKAAKRYG